MLWMHFVPRQGKLSEEVIMLDNMVVIALYVAVPATILAVAFIAVLRKEERQTKEDLKQEVAEQDKNVNPPRT